MSNAPVDFKGLPKGQRAIFEKFKDLSMAKSPQEKQKTFIELIGFLKKAKVDLNQATGGVTNV